MTLHAAIRRASLAQATEHLAACANPNSRDARGLTPLMIAAGLGQSQMVELLLGAGGDVLAIEPRMGATALHKAAQSGNPDVIALLLDHGAFIDQQSPIIGVTPLADAVLYKRPEAVRLLLGRGARTTIQNHWGETPLDFARQDHLHDIAALIEDRNRRDADCVAAMPLVAAVKAGDLLEVRRLIEAGEAVEARVPMMGSFDDNYTPLGLAAREGHLGIARALLDAGADPRRTIGLFRGTPVHEAAYFGRTEMIDLFAALPHLGDAPAIELDAQGAYNGLTPLHDAVWRGHAGAARARLSRRVPPCTLGAMRG